MGIYYEYAIVHGRVLIWWSDNDGVAHSKWIEGEDAVKLYGFLSKMDIDIQRELAAATKIKD
jgi:hypothetical protein